VRSPIQFSKPVTELITQRYSCRNYLEALIDEAKCNLLRRFVGSSQVGPFGMPVRFGLIAATDEDPSALRGLGTYGFIKGATGYIAGVVGDGKHNLEDFGYLMERAILFATDLDLGTCWLGGTFTKSRFAKRFGVHDGEEMPAVTSIGYDADQPHLQDSVSRRVANSNHRLPWERLFFEGRFGTPLPPEVTGDYATALQMVRLGPSASNKQPWRIVREGERWHFFIERSFLYGPRTLGLVGIADMQRLDIGIAMCHFELSARELGLGGEWRIEVPSFKLPSSRIEYSATWFGESLP
jgi:nitroreductase